MKRSYFSRIAAFVLAISIFTSCVETPVDTPSAAPQLPDTETFTMPTAALDHTDSDTSAAATHTSGHTYRNWIYAGINLAVWHTVVVVNVAVPTAAFARAANETPVHIGNGVFEWAYQYQAPPALGGKNYDVVLTAEYINAAQEVEWIMTVSEQGGFSNFEWYRGTSAVDGSESHFTVYHQPYNPEPYMQMDFQGGPNVANQSLRFTNIRPNRNDTGSYIEYRVEPNSPFNRAFDVNAGPNHPGKYVEIQWNEPSRDGRVKGPQFYNDTDWHCWDAHQVDTDC